MPKKGSTTVSILGLFVFGGLGQGVAKIENRLPELSTLVS